MVYSTTASYKKTIIMIDEKHHDYYKLK